MNEIYLIFDRHAHTGIHFVQAGSVSEAIWKYISYQTEGDVILQADGSLRDDQRYFPDLLTYIEAGEKMYGEWQIRKLPEWMWDKVKEGLVIEAFCGESEDGPPEVIAECRKHFRKSFPRSRAKAFVWYLKQGTLVTFYHKKRPYNIAVLKRYLYYREGHELMIEEWIGSNVEIIESLLLEPYKPSYFT